MNIFHSCLYTLKSLYILSLKSWQPHLKKCAQENNVPAHQLLEIVKQQDQHQREMESTSHQTEERTEARPNEDGKKKTGQARKKRKVGKDLRYTLFEIILCETSHVDERQVH